MGNIVKVMTPDFRVSFPTVFEAKAMPGAEKKKFGLVALFNMEAINKSPEQLKKWKEMIRVAELAIAEKWPKGRPTNLQTPFRKGEEKAQFDGYGEGVIFVSLTTMTKPGVVDGKLTPIIDPAEFYAGCYARATVNAYAWTFAGKNGVSFGLQNVQKLRDGDRFGGRTNAEDDFDATPDAPALGGAEAMLFGGAPDASASLI